MTTPPSGNSPRYVSQDQYESDKKVSNIRTGMQNKRIDTSFGMHVETSKRLDRLEVTQKKTAAQVQALHNAVIGSNRPHSRNQPPKAETKVIKEIRGNMLTPRPTIVFEDDQEVNVWNYRAPIGNAIGNWKPGDPVALTRNVGGNGIDPDRVTNLNLYDETTETYEAVDGNKDKKCRMM